MKKYIQKLKQLIQTCYWDWKRLLAFEIIYKLFGGIVLLPFFNFLLKKSLDMSHLEYLNMQVVSSWLQRPFSIAILFFMMLTVGLYVFYEMIFLVLYLEKAWKKQRFTLHQLMGKSLHHALRILHPKNWSVFGIIIFLLPFTVLMLKPSSLSDFQIPEYFIDFLKEMGTAYYGAYLIGLLLVNFLAFYMFHVLAIFLLQEQSFPNAWRETRKLLKKRKIKLILMDLVMLAGILFLLILIFIVALLILILFANKENTQANMAAFLLQYMQLKQYTDFLYPIVLFTLGFLVILYNFLSIHDDAQQFIPYPRKNRWKRLLLGGGELLLTVLIIGFYFDYQGNIFEKQKILEKDIAITAHRAGTTFTPENTLDALKYSIQMKADYAEIDVQQSKDKQLYVMHDVNFKRTSGVDKNIWDVDSSEINTYDAGSYFSYDFKDARIPTLEDMVKTANGKIKLMIELKKNGHEQNLVEDTLSLLQKYQFQKQCVIASMDLEILQQVKALDPSFQTVFIAPVAYGNYYDLSYVDMYSIEATFVNNHMLTSLHENNKKVFVWTVNKDSELKRLLSMDIDGIVTDNPELAQYYKKAQGKDSLISDILNWLYPQNNESITY